ncbi:phage integrase [Vibrio vulnificus]
MTTVRHMVQTMGNPVASAFSSKMYSDFRSKRMSGGLSEAITRNPLNNL